MILVDTNLLARMANVSDSLHGAAWTAVKTLRKRKEQLVIVPQNLYEFWAVGTRAKGGAGVGENGLGLPCEDVSKWIVAFSKRFVLLHDRSEMVEAWHNLVASLRITGLKAHDARIVAAMRVHGVDTILTFNGKHFQFDGVTVIDPSSLR